MQKALYSIQISVSPVVCNVPVSCKASGDRDQFGVWRDSDPQANNMALSILHFKGSHLEYSKLWCNCP